MKHNNFMTNGNVPADGTGMGNNRQNNGGYFPPPIGKRAKGLDPIASYGNNKS